MFLNRIIPILQGGAYVRIMPRIVLGFVSMDWSEVWGLNPNANSFWMMWELCACYTYMEEFYSEDRLADIFRMRIPSVHHLWGPSFLSLVIWAIKGDAHDARRGVTPCHLQSDFYLWNAHGAYRLGLRQQNHLQYARSLCFLVTILSPFRKWKRYFEREMIWCAGHTPNTVAHTGCALSYSHVGC